MTEVRVRFAPSPTGVLHLGGARTALFNWLFARHEKGKFLLRIEDTDRERSTAESTQAILDAMRWLGMDWDEDLLFQSARLPEHKKALDKLIAKGCVYKCTCTPEEREKMREEAIAQGRTLQYDGRCDGKPDDPAKPFVWRFRMPKQGETVVDDMVQGRVVTPNTELEDIVIARADNSPLYNFVVVIDDAFMGITHVIRGKDHLTNTPKQIQIYKALGLEAPRFGHLPLILGLSKRLRSSGIESYREQGYLPEAVINYIARLGWSHGDEELFTPEELVSKFTIEGVNRSEGALNLDKMEWLNQQHLMKKEPAELAALVTPFLPQVGLQAAPPEPRLAMACATVRQRSKTLADMAERLKFYFLPDEAIALEPAAAQKHLTAEAKARLGAMASALADLADWSEQNASDAVNRFCETSGIKLKNVAQPTRVALTGGETGPGLFEMMIVLGKESTVARLKRAAAM